MAHLLLIDDDELFREMLARVLIAAGHTVTQTAEGRMALTLDDVDLVITDLVMPHQEGLETIVAVQRMRPGLPVIAISGALAGSSLYLRMAVQLGAVRTLAKPFAPDELLCAIDELLVIPPEPPATG